MSRCEGTRALHSQDPHAAAKGKLKNDRIYSGASPTEVEADLRPLLDFREEGLPLDEVRSIVERHLLPHLMRYDLPTFQSMFNTFPERGAEFGARTALAWNQGVTNWQVSPGGAVLEELCMRSMCSLFGLETGSDATVMYCGTYANQQAIYMALHRRAEEYGLDLADVGVSGFDDPTRLAVVASRDAHFSVRHAVRMLGLGERSLVLADVASNRRIDAGALRETLGELSDHRDVFCTVATAGTTSTGAVDPIGAIADLCQDTGTWLHVDGAYGLAYKLVPEWSHLYTGLERADSASWDPHKQFGVPIPSSILFAKRAADFARMALFSGYFNRPDAAGPDPGIKSVPSTRPLTVLPLVTSLLHLGMRGVVDRLEKPLYAIRETAQYIDQHDDLTLCHHPDTGIVCFRAIPVNSKPADLDDLQRDICSRIMQAGERTISVTQLAGMTVLRLVAVSPSVTSFALRDTVDEVVRFARGMTSA